MHLFLDREKIRFFFHRKHLFLHTCAAFSELPSNISTMVQTVIMKINIIQPQHLDSLDTLHTVCPRSLDPFNISSYYIYYIGQYISTSTRSYSHYSEAPENRLIYCMSKSLVHFHIQNF